MLLGVTLGQYLLRRIVQSVPVVFLVTVIAFVVVMLLPGDAAVAFLGETNIHDKVAYEAMREELGLNRPLPVQYAIWLGRALRGDLGKSIRTQEPVLEGLLARLPVTLELTVMVLVLAILISVPMGIVSALRPNSWTDISGTVLTIGGAAIPDFCLGIMLIYIFAVWLKVAPPSGYVPLKEGLWPNVRSMLLPAMSLGTYLTAVAMRQTRASLIEVMQQEYVTVARAKGLRESGVVVRHALKNALIPVVTVIGLQVGRLFGGAVVVETIFALPGIGRVAADSISFRDFPMLQGAILIMALGVLVANLATDVIYAFVDPRIRYV